ncbi:hypothetical protein SRABI04_01703 [Chryseobacterium sp. Bi04]|nr:hypothetical protein SRABI04_01703 [Chryseobacterium sp. Bi04]
MQEVNEHNVTYINVLSNNIPDTKSVWILSL